MDPLTIATLIKAGPALLRGVGRMFGGKTAEVIDSAANIVEEVQGKPDADKRLKEKMMQQLSGAELAELERIKGTIQTELAKIEAAREDRKLTADERGVDQLNERLASYEGTASDLKSLPFLGALMLFLRGCQRPVWGFGTLYMDVLLINGDSNLPASSQFGWMMLIINLLVLGFLFGERAVLNLQPLILRVMEMVMDKRVNGK